MPHPSTSSESTTRWVTLPPTLEWVGFETLQPISPCLGVFPGQCATSSLIMISLITIPKEKYYTILYVKAEHFWKFFGPSTATDFCVSLPHGGEGISKEICGTVRLPVSRHVSRQWLSKWRAKCSSKRRIKISILSRKYCSDFLDLEILRFLWS